MNDRDNCDTKGAHALKATCNLQASSRIEATVADIEKHTGAREFKHKL